MLGTIRKSVTYPQPREMVWQALTDSDALAAWLMPNDFRPEIGHQFTFRTDPAPGFDGIVHCEVLELRPPELWRISWAGGGLWTELTITLRVVQGGTRLDLTHKGFGLKDAVPRVILGLGWGRIVRRHLRAYLERAE